MGNLDSLDSPRPGLKGSHHLPPQSILCSSAQRLHPNGSFSRDSQSGVPKLSGFGLLGFWAFITSRLKLGLGRRLNQSCIFHRELSNAMLHSYCRRRKEVDSRLLVAVWLLALLLPITWAADVQTAHARPFWTSRLQDLSNGIKNTLMRGVLTPELDLWIFKNPGRLQLPTLGSVGFTLTLIPKWGCDMESHPKVGSCKWRCMKCLVWVDQPSTWC
jgi:hypothetical protein